MPNNLNNLILTDIKVRVLYAPSQRFIEHQSQARNQNTDSRPSAKVQPSVHQQSAALGVEGDGPGEKEEGVDVECCEANVSPSRSFVHVHSMRTTRGRRKKMDKLTG